MIQTESPYFQPSPPPPAPFKAVVGKFPGDPTYSCPTGEFSSCDESWAVIVEGCQNIHIGGAGTYSWFSTYSQDYIDIHSCQKMLVYLEDEKVRFQHINFIGARYIFLASNGTGTVTGGVLSYSNMHSPIHSGLRSIFDVVSQGKAPVTIPHVTKPDDKCPGIGQDAELRGHGAGRVLLHRFPRFHHHFDLEWLLHYDCESHTVKVECVNLVGMTARHLKLVRRSPRQSASELVRYESYDGFTVDDNDEANYSLEGIDKTFVVRASTHSGGTTRPMCIIFDLAGMGDVLQAIHCRFNKFRRALVARKRGHLGHLGVAAFIGGFLIDPVVVSAKLRAARVDAQLLPRLRVLVAIFVQQEQSTAFAVVMVHKVVRRLLSQFGRRIRESRAAVVEAHQMMASPGLSAMNALVSLMMSLRLIPVLLNGALAFSSTRCAAQNPRPMTFTMRMSKNQP
ncbi:hypothetical protein B0T25DRAFT_530413 [Lasiosphaeria hispida]|uniref:Uncharacterized protein n=1 Tax=Lasiosphaeria hispida TaxID=260671 RepID=A0AAJ0HXP9_9PEZI|nr:hypothetical protein B0T25DRAFT_530413 [Lasiosphaeria hispida]